MGLLFEFKEAQRCDHLLGCCHHSRWLP